MRENFKQKKEFMVNLDNIIFNITKLNDYGETKYYTPECGMEPITTISLMTRPLYSM